MGDKTRMVTWGYMQKNLECLPMKWLGASSVFQQGGDRDKSVPGVEEMGGGRAEPRGWQTGKLLEYPSERRQSIAAGE